VDALKLIWQEDLNISAVGEVSSALTRVSVKGENGQRDISSVSIEPTIYFSVFPGEILSEVGASSESLKARLELDDGRIVEASVYSVIVATCGRENVTLAATYDGAVSVLGAKFLEDFGLKVDSESGSLAPTRFQGFAYNFER
jgi:hypothetical protein